MEGQQELRIYHEDMGLCPGFVFGEADLWPPVTVDGIPQGRVADNESKEEAFDLVVFYGDKVATLGPTTALMERDELGSCSLQLSGNISQCPLIGFDLEIGLKRWRGR
jgi:hypothetical protein